jgi:2-methylcitrate dehydratase
MEVVEDASYTKDYMDPDKRSIANSIQVFFRDGKSTERVEVEYPLGHRRRREEGIPLLLEKCRSNLNSRLSNSRVEELMELFLSRHRLKKTPVHEFMGMLVK